MRSAYYQPSGRVSPRAIVITLLLTSLLLPLAWLYAWTVFHLPQVIAFFSALTLSFLVFLATTGVIHWGKVRNAAAASAIGVLVGAIAWYAHWAFLAALADHSAGGSAGAYAYARHPAHLYGAISAITRPGAGTLLKWLLEFGAMVVLPALSAAGMARRPFCEVAGDWADEIKLDKSFAAIDDDAIPAFRAALESAPAQAKALLAEGKPKPTRHAQVSVYPCEQAGIAYLSVCNVTQRFHASGLKETRTSVVDLLTIPLPVALDLVAHGGVTGAASPAAPETQSAPDGADTPPELLPALSALEAEQYEQAITLALPYCTPTQPTLHLDALRLCAIAYARLERWDEAAEHYKGLYAAEARVHNALQLAASSIMAGRLEEGEKWMRSTLALNRDTPELPAIQVYTTFITALKQRGYLRQAMPYLEAVKEIYEQLHLTDPTFLTLRGVPFFISFLEQSAPVVDASMDAAQARAWYQSMLPHLDPPGRDELKAWLLERNDTSMPAN